MQKQRTTFHTLPIFILVFAALIGMAMIGAAFYSATDINAEGSLFAGSEELQSIFVAVAFAFVAMLALLIISMLVRSHDLKVAMRQLEEDGRAALSHHAPTEALTKEEETEAEPSEPRFFMLGEIDAEMASYHRPPFDTKITLPELCEQFREFAASR
ncbi:MAG: hypothetical protein IJW22_09205, partial [Clostridia bacterium]|nr:hypothetical protein [Clostridia bacterium]